MTGQATFHDEEYASLGLCREEIVQIYFGMPQDADTIGNVHSEGVTKRLYHTKGGYVYDVQRS